VGGYLNGRKDLEEGGVCGSKLWQAAVPTTLLSIVCFIQTLAAKKTIVRVHLKEMQIMAA
jgi:hypothetical protein